MTLGNMRDALRCRSVEAVCQACRHEAVVSCDALPACLPVPDVALRLRCTVCGSKNVITKPNMAEFYAKMPGGLGKHPNHR
jgi:hypothetical protein